MGYVNKRAVRILVECILVKYEFSYWSLQIVAEPVVEDCLNGANLTDDAVFIHCGVGERDL